MQQILIHFIHRSTDSILFYIIESELTENTPNSEHVVAKQFRLDSDSITVRTIVRAYGTFNKTDAIRGIDFHVDLNRELRKRKLTMPRERTVDLLYLAAYELSRKLDDDNGIEELVNLREALKNFDATLCEK